MIKFLAVALFSLTSHAALQRGSLAPDRGEIPEIHQDQFAVVSAEDHSALQTYGVTTCIVVTLYDAKEKLGAMMHVSASTKIPEAVALVLRDLKKQGSSLRHLQAQLHGGWAESMSPDGFHFESPRMVSELQSELIGRRVDLTYVDVLAEANDVAAGRQAIWNIEMDLKTGHVYSFQPAVSGPQVGQSMPANPL